MISTEQFKKFSRERQLELIISLFTDIGEMEEVGLLQDTSDYITSQALVSMYSGVCEMLHNHNAQGFAEIKEKLEKVREQSLAQHVQEDKQAERILKNIGR